jgi:hypothetical protein
MSLFFVSCPDSLFLAEIAERIECFVWNITFWLAEDTATVQKQLEMQWRV